MLAPNNPPRNDFQLKKNNRDRASQSSTANTTAINTTTEPAQAKPPLADFSSFQFSDEITKAISELGFTAPTPIQQETIPLLLNNQTDFLGLAATGTGKTAAFGIPLLENMDAPASKTKQTVQALILCPTRELAKQVTEQLNLLARYKKTKACAIYGGSDYASQLRTLKDGISIVVGTPGRIIDHLERKTLNLNTLKTVVLDEADEMISMGFKTEIERILQAVQQADKHQTWLFSATMSREVKKISEQFLTDPLQIQINKTEVVASGVEQIYYQLREDEKPNVIAKVIDLNPDFYGIIFCQTKALVVDLTQHLKNQGYKVDCLHGDMDQNARERTMKSFKNKFVNIIVCTDVASRGIDVKELTHVINYSLPRELDLYIHRIGRTGRGGNKGIALSLVTASHQGLVGKIEKATRSQMKKMPIPSDAELLDAKLLAAYNSFANITDESNIQTIIQKITKSPELSQWMDSIDQMDKAEIVARFLSQSIRIQNQKNQAPQESRAERRSKYRDQFREQQRDRSSRHERHARPRDQKRERYQDRDRRQEHGQENRQERSQKYSQERGKVLSSNQKRFKINKKPSDKAPLFSKKNKQGKASNNKYS